MNNEVIISLIFQMVQKNNFNVRYFDGMTYSACGKGNANTQEVLITNY